MPPPPAEPLASRIFLGPALRAQPDRRLVKLVREGYEAAFEEIVRRYRRPLDRFAAAIVGGRSEDVTQDAFSKALLALRGTTTEIELKPWLYRIVRNTALNDLRDGPPATEELGESIPGARSAAEVAEGREQIGELMERLRALPEPQRAAIVMRELEGLSHEEIAAALGVSGGAARQAIYRGRMALRDGFGLLIPLPLLRALFDHGAEAAGAGAGGVAAAGVASAAGGGSGAMLGGLGASAALKVGVATAVLAGSIGAGVAMRHDHGGHGAPGQAETAATRPAGNGASPEAVSYRGPGGPGQDPQVDSSDGRGHGGPGSGGGRGGDDSDNHVGGGHHSEDRGHSGHGGEIAADDFDDRGGGPAPSGSSDHGRGSGRDGHSGSEDHSGEEISGGSQSGSQGSGGGSGDGSGGGGSGSRGGGSHDSSNDSPGGSGSGGGSGGPGSGEDPAASATSPTPAPAPPPAESGEPPEGSSGSGGGDSGSSNGSGSGGSGGGSDDS
ncbi:MAG TPA: RNA polymerase sigma factor [Solirubrobacterales bacterium]|jgi:RNA polymerase sigma factor (sigma-70 family)|nr:RNA polymerase sigma factor [Solirubrobacterales bacterium]